MREMNRLKRLKRLFTTILQGLIGLTLLLLPTVGQTATVSLPLPPSDGTLRLPLAAVFEHQGRSSVWLLDKATMTVRAQAIQVVGAEGNAILVASGLNPGQTVVSAGVHALAPGQKVSLYVEPGSAAAAAAAATTAAR